MDDDAARFVATLILGALAIVAMSALSNVLGYEKWTLMALDLGATCGVFYAARRVVLGWEKVWDSIPEEPRDD